VPETEVAALRNVRFSTARRGYDPDEVDRYINRVNQVLAELQITASPESAIKYAYEEVRRETRSVVEEAEREAEEITRRSRSRADDRIQEATEEAQALREEAQDQARRLRDAAIKETKGTRAAAEARIRELEDDVQAMMERRDRAVQELVELANSLAELVDALGGENGAGGDRGASPQPAIGN
jgi:V/A-type H+/Na+-transporting ATPase subunit G/H